MNSIHKDQNYDEIIEWEIMSETIELQRASHHFNCIETKTWTKVERKIERMIIYPSVEEKTYGGKAVL